MTAPPAPRSLASPLRIAVAACAALALVAAALVWAGPVRADEAGPAADWTPELQVSKTTGVSRDGETVTVTGSGFDPAAHTGTRPPLMGQPSGVYVVFGKFEDVWKPSAGAPSSARHVIDQMWAAPASAAGVLGGTGQYVELTTEGTFTTTLDLAMAEDEPGHYGVYTYAGSGAVNAAQELYVPIEFAPEGATTTTTTTPPSTTTTTTPPSTTTTTAPSTTTTTAPQPTTTTTAPPATTSTTVATGPLDVLGGQLDWGVKSTFRTYISGPIAGGSITPSGGATANGDGTFRFPATGGEVDASGEPAEIAFEGQVRFTGHGGQLDLTIRDPRVVLDGGRGALVADIESVPLQAGALGAAPAAAVPQAGELFDDVVLAELDVAAAPNRVETVITWSDLTATLTEAGVPAFSDFYPAGSELDPLHVSVELSGVPDVPEGEPGQPGAGGGSGTGGTGSGASPVAVRGALPYTGSSTAPYVAMGAGLLVLGAAGVAGARRRQAARR